MFVKFLKDYLGVKQGQQVDVSDQDAEALSKAGLCEKVQTDLLNPAIERAMAAQFDVFSKAVDAALAKFQQAQGLARRHAVPAIFGADGNGDPHRNFGDWALCVAKGNRKRLEEVYKSTFNSWKEVPDYWGKAALAESSGAQGGYAVPPDFYQGLLLVMSEDGIFRANGAFVQPMGSATMQFPYLDVTTAQSAGNSPFFGGVIAYWTEEAQSRTESEPQFKMMELKAHELAGYSVSSNVLLADAAFGLEKFLMTLFGRAIAWYEDYGFLQGNGVGKPVGTTNAGATLTTGPNTGSRTTANTIKLADIAYLVSKLIPASFKRSIWVFSPTCIPQILQLSDGSNRVVFISIDQGVVKAPVWSILGRPAYVTEKLPALGTSGDIQLIDPSLYVIGDRQQLEIAASEHVNFLKNQMTWRFIQRVDGQPWLEKPITLQDGTTQVAPFVALHS
jgi:HK97 family phage major capsid protein